MTKGNLDNNPHKGHRNRMRAKFLASGADSMPTHELLEMLLYYCVPQKDTNEMAHQLIERFGSLDGVLSASSDELCNVPGIKETGSVLISLVYELNRRRELERTKLPKAFERTEDIGNYLIALYKHVSVEKFYMILLDNGMRPIDTVCLSVGSVNSTDSNIRKIVENALFKHASGVVIAHNHPNGRAIPSKSDLDTTYDINSALRLVGINLIEHFLIADDKYVELLNRSCGC